MRYTNAGSKILTIYLFLDYVSIDLEIVLSYVLMKHRDCNFFFIRMLVFRNFTIYCLIDISVMRSNTYDYKV